MGLKFRLNVLCRRAYIYKKATASSFASSRFGQAEKLEPKLKGSSLCPKHQIQLLLSISKKLLRLMTDH